jgi:uncharacterized protein YaaQ
MKLLVAIIRAQDTDSILTALVEADFGVTHIASTGGFLRRGNATLLIATEDDRIDTAVEVIREAASPPDENQRRATVFVLKLEEFEKL